MTASMLQQLTKPQRWPAPGDDDSSRLALDLAMAIKPVAALLEDYGITAAQLRRRMRDKNYREQVREYRRIWDSPLNAAERVRIKSAVMAEDALADVWSILTNPEVHPGVRLDAHKHIVKLADVEPQRAAADVGPRFSLTLNLGGAGEVVVDTAVDTHDNDDYDNGKTEVYDSLPGLRGTA